jgi:hypothetical protein
MGVHSTKTIRIRSHMRTLEAHSLAQSLQVLFGDTIGPVRHMNCAGAHMISRFAPTRVFGRGNFLQAWTKID